MWKAQGPHGSSPEVTLWVFISLVRLGFVSWKWIKLKDWVCKFPGKINLRILSDMEFSQACQYAFLLKPKLRWCHFLRARKLDIIYVFMFIAFLPGASTRYRGPWSLHSQLKEFTTPTKGADSYPPPGRVKYRGVLKVYAWILTDWWSGLGCGRRSSLWKSRVRWGYLAIIIYITSWGEALGLEPLHLLFVQVPAIFLQMPAPCVSVVVACQSI